MKFYSTKSKEKSYSFSEAISMGLADDGGLFVPEYFPSKSVEDFANLNSMAEIAQELLKDFFQGDVLEKNLARICQQAFDFEVPLVEVRSLRESVTANASSTIDPDISTATAAVPDVATATAAVPYIATATTAVGQSTQLEFQVLELFHGPTLAFKDVGARFLANCISGKKLAVMVATSGDTGGAVAGAFVGKPGIQVYILYPEGKISARQETQLTCWGGNVKAFAVQGTFDDCQRMVKSVLSSAEAISISQMKFISANSINIGRLLPQMVYYAKSSLEYFRVHAVKCNYIIPSGNLGNAVAAFWARKMGLPIGKIVLATNANRPIPDFFQTGRWEPRASVMTLANAMDVGNPSNMERFLDLYSDPLELQKEIQSGQIQSFSVTDEQIRQTIAEGPSQWNQIWCPHTATAVYCWEKYIQEPHWVAVATAHASKFDSVVEPLIQQKIPVPVELQSLLDRPTKKTVIRADVDELMRNL
jgi:threonine synthase